MQIKIEGAQNAAQAAEVEKILAGALASSEIQHTKIQTADGDSPKALGEILSMAFLLRVGETALVEVAAKSLATAVMQVFSNPENRGLSFTFKDYRFDFDQFTTNKLDRFAEYIRANSGDAKTAPTRYALVIGVSHSSADTTIPRLRFTEQDARSVAETVRTLEEGAFDVATMINPTAHELRAAIHGFLDKKGPNDDLFLFYSGHGFVSSDGTYLCCYDTEISRLALNGLSLDEIGRFTNSCKANQILIALDCCYSGGANKLLFNDAARRLLDAPHSDCSIHLITSSAPKQVSKEDAAKEMGLFSYFLVEGIKTAAAAGADGDITAASLHRHIRNNIKNTQSPAYSVKDKKDEFFISRKTTPLLTIFNEIKQTVTSFVERNMVSFQYAGKVLENCFGSSEVPKVRRDKFIDAVRDFKAGRITFDDFRRIHDVRTPPIPPSGDSAPGFTRKQLIIGAVVILVLLWLFGALSGG
jgi:hypothetical protein